MFRHTPGSDNLFHWKLNTIVSFGVASESNDRGRYIAQSLTNAQPLDLWLDRMALPTPV